MQMLSLPYVLEKLSLEANIDIIHFAIDPISLKVASQISLKKLRKKYIKSLEGFISEWSADPVDTVVVLSPEKFEVSRVISLLNNIVPILQQNGKKPDVKLCIFVILARSEELVRDILCYSIRYGTELLLPFDLEAFANSMLTLARNKRSGIIICEPSLIEESLVISSQPVETKTSMTIDTSTIEIGSGPVVALAFGVVFKSIFNVLLAQKMLDMVRLIGILKFDSSLANHLVDVLKNHKYIVVADQTGTIKPLIHSLAYDLVARGELKWIPEIVDISKGLDGSVSIDSLDISQSLKDFLALGARAEDVLKIQTRNEIYFLVPDAISKFIKGITGRRQFSVLCIKPLSLGLPDASSLEIQELAKCVFKSENMIVVVHMSHLTEFFDIFEFLLKENDKTVIIIADTSLVEKGLLSKLKNELHDVLKRTGMSIPMIDLAEYDLDKIIDKLKKFKKMAILA
ncbi:MAG: hypothetical protein NDP13_05875 [Crenarchaeota archaeon]|nr:hypothetical protein [Thermoproteota archaeon]